MMNTVKTTSAIPAPEPSSCTAISCEAPARMIGLDRIDHCGSTPVCAIAAPAASPNGRYPSMTRAASRIPARVAARARSRSVSGGSAVTERVCQVRTAGARAASRCVAGSARRRRSEARRTSEPLFSRASP